MGSLVIESKAEGKCPKERSLSKWVEQSLINMGLQTYQVINQV